jgi:hypothetical protein
VGAGRGVGEFELRDAERTVPDLVRGEVDGDEHVGFVAAGFEPVFGTEEADFLLNGGEEDEVAFGLDVAAIDGAEHLERRHEVAGVVADTGGSEGVTFALDFDEGVGGKDGVGVGGEARSV